MKRFLLTLFLFVLLLTSCSSYEAIPVEEVDLFEIVDLGDCKIIKNYKDEVENKTMEITAKIKNNVISVNFDINYTYKTSENYSIYYSFENNSFVKYSKENNQNWEKKTVDANQKEAYDKIIPQSSNTICPSNEVEFKEFKKMFIIYFLILEPNSNYSNLLNLYESYFTPQLGGVTECLLMDKNLTLYENLKGRYANPIKETLSLQDKKYSCKDVFYTPYFEGEGQDRKFVKEELKNQNTFKFYLSNGKVKKMEYVEDNDLYIGTTITIKSQGSSISVPKV